MSVDTDNAAVEEANVAFYAAFEAMDIERMRQLWDDADDTVCVHPGWPALQGGSRIMRSWAVIFANTAYIQFFLTETEVLVADDIAVVRCGENIMTAPDEPGGDARVVATNIFRRRADGWRLWLHHASPVLGAGTSDE